MAVEVWGVDQTHVQSYLPQVAVGSSSPVTSTRLTEIIEGAASRINAMLRGLGLDPADVASDTSADWYRACQRLVILFAKPDILDATHHPGSWDARQDYLQEAYDELERLRDNMRQAIGYTAASAETVGPIGITSTNAYDLDLTDVEAGKRRKFDGKRGAKKEGRFTW
jgi:hypothetical protein